MSGNAIDLAGRTAIVTGAARGIGRRCAERFLESGAAVVIWDVDRDAAQDAAAQLSRLGRVSAHAVDVSDLSSVQAAWEATQASEPRIDILVNNAGIAGPNATTWDYPVEAWRRIHAINLDGTFHCCRTVVPHMIANGYGRIVNVASIAAKEGNPNASAYSSSKAGVVALTKSLGKELAGYDIAVNCVTPAAARTPIFDQMSQEHIDYMLSKIPRRRFAEVDEIAALIAWLASSENSFATGAVFDISGGRATY